VTVTLDLAPSKGTRTRQAILDAAIARFAAAGRQGTSVAGIAREVGLTPSAVYAYFPTKQALFEEAVDADAAGLISDALPEILGGSFDGDFAAVFTRLLEALPRHPLARRVLAGEEGTGVERLVQLPSEQRLHSGLTLAIARGQAEGVVRGDVDPQLLAIGYETIVVALIIAILQSGGSPPDDMTSLGVLAVLDAALRPGGAAGSRQPAVAGDRRSGSARR
jgi:AcrR family transcriptional regulator